MSKTYLIAHTSKTDIAQATVKATSAEAAQLLFKVLYPHRTITLIGIQGEAN